VSIEQGRVRLISDDLYDRERRWKNLNRNMDGHYVETIYPPEGGYQRRIFKIGFLSEETMEGADYAANAYYHHGRLGFWTKQIKDDAKKGILNVFDDDDKLVDIVKMVFGEYYEIKFEERAGKPVKIFRKTLGNKVVNEVVKEMN